MSSYTQLTPEWQEWIIDNLERGCQAQTLVQTMIGKGFDAMFANAVVFHFSANPVQRYTPNNQNDQPVV